MAASSRRLDIDISSHLTSDELALLAEGRAGEAAINFREHLAHCKDCFQAYHDAVEFRAQSLVGQEPAAPSELLQNGRNIPFRRSVGAGVTRKPHWRIIVASVAAVVVIGAAWMFFGPRETGKTSLPVSDVAVLGDLVADASAKGLVFPETPEVRSGRTVYRSGDLGSSPDVRRIVERLRMLEKEGKATPDDLFWLASAELASGNLERARLYLTKAEGNTDPRLLKLRGILAYRESDLTDAERDLREVISKYPNDAETELNLGLVLLAEAGKGPEAAQFLQRARASKDSQISKRAELALDSLSSH